MRKKYLSALLFGALLFASAGTFTSCKDYDDDIKDLQGQIDAINTTLTELKGQIGAKGVSSVTFDEKTGVLTVVDGEGTKTYTIQTSAEAKVEAEIKNGKLYINGEEIGAVGGGDSVKVENGKLYINDEVAYEFGPKVVLVKNVDEGTCTITVGNESVTLPLAVASVDFKLKVTKNDGDNSIFGFANQSVSNNYNASEHGIYWGNSANEVEWKGPKGNIAKGQFLVGQINTASVNVTPATFDLNDVKLELVNTAGEVAPVVVKATPANSETVETGSRAADKKGAWNLSVEMKSEVNADNVATAFATKVNGLPANMKYALKANGAIVSDYDFVIDTQESITDVPANAPLSDNCKLNGEQISGNLELGKAYKFEYAGDRVYDYYITFAGKDINDAEYNGVTIKNNVITASNSAAGQSFKLDVHIVDVLGNKLDSENPITITFAGVSTDAEELSTVQYKVTPISNTDDNKELIINLEDAFSGLTAEQATSINKVVWSSEDEEFLFDNSILSNGITYYKDAECNELVDVKEWDGTSNIKEIKYAKITGKYANSANVGTHVVTMSLQAEASSEIYSDVKKFNIPVNVILPAFDELLTKSASWTEGKEEAQFRLTENGEFTAMTAYKLAEGVALSSSNYLEIEFEKVKAENGNLVSPITSSSSSDNIQKVEDNAQTITFNSNVLDKDSKFKTLNAESRFVISGNKNFIVKSSKYSVVLKTVLDDAKLVYLNDKGEEADFNITGTTATFKTYSNTNKNNCVAIKFEGKYYSMNGKDLLNGVTINAANWSFIFNAQGGTIASGTYTYDNKGGKLEISGLPDNGSNYAVEMTPSYLGAVKLDNDKLVKSELPIVTLNVTQK